MHRIKDKLRREIDQIADKPGELGHGDLETLNKLTDALKDIEEICAMEEHGGGYSGRRHYVRGHYSMDGMHNMDDMDGYPGVRRGRDGRYARDGGREDTMSYLTAAMSTSDEEDREMIRRLMDKMRER